jgi:hypothetical protein
MSRMKIVRLRHYDVGSETNQFKKLLQMFNNNKSMFLYACFCFCTLAIDKCTSKREETDSKVGHGRLDFSAIFRRQIDDVLES